MVDVGTTLDGPDKQGVRPGEAFRSGRCRCATLRAVDSGQFERRGVRFRIFGRPMHTWREQMPNGMILKSDGFASNLSDPDQCSRYSASASAPALPTTIRGFRHTREVQIVWLAFQQRVPEFEDVHVTCPL